MATISVGIVGLTPVTPSVDVLTLDSGANAGQQFMVIRLGEDATAIGPGQGREQVAYGRALAQALLDAAASIERALDHAASEAATS